MSDDKPASARKLADDAMMTLLMQQGGITPDVAKVAAALAIADELAALRGVLGGGRDTETARNADSVTADQLDALRECLDECRRHGGECDDCRNAAAAFDVATREAAATRARGDGRDDD